MYEKELTLKVSTQDITSCNICYARNYDTTNPDPLGERADRLYELRIGGQVMVLCDKCLARLRDKLEQRLDAEKTPTTAAGQTVLCTGRKFIATDKLHQTYRYRMIGVDPSHDGLIRLMNLSTDSVTHVEPAWFRQRKIKVLQKGGAQA